MTRGKDRKGRYAILAAVFVVMLAVGAWVGGQLNQLLFESVQTKEIKGKNINILVMGIDARNAKENSRSDTMILASLDPGSGQVVLISIPRDTRIKNAKGQNDRINSINWLQGPEAACKQVARLLNVPVDYYVVTNFGGFDDIVDALGGVHIDVQSNMYHADPVTPELAINLKKGYQYLDGKQALAYVRYRGGPTADIGRTENQQRFIKALAAEMRQSKTIVRLPQLIPELAQNVHTNIPLPDMIYLGNMAQKLDMENMITQTLPGYFLNDSETGASYWEPDTKIASTLIADLKNGAVIKVVQEAPPGTRPVKMVTRPTAEVEPPSGPESQKETVGEQGTGADGKVNEGDKVDKGDKGDQGDQGSGDTDSKVDGTGSDKPDPGNSSDNDKEAGAKPDSEAPSGGSESDGVKPPAGDTEPAPTPDIRP